jgi:hypothetical protein
LNLRPSGYEPDELPDCSTPRRGTHGSSPATGWATPMAGDAGLEQVLPGGGVGRLVDPFPWSAPQSEVAARPT